MEQETRILIIGDSVLVEGITHGLSINPPINLQRISLNDAYTLHHVASFRPHMIIYPLGIPSLESILFEASQTSAVRLVGLDIECNQVVITDSKVHRALSLDALRDLLQLRDPGSPALHEGTTTPPVPLRRQKAGQGAGE